MSRSASSDRRIMSLAPGSVPGPAMTSVEPSAARAPTTESEVTDMVVVQVRPSVLVPIASLPAATWAEKKWSPAPTINRPPEPSMGFAGATTMPSIGGVMVDDVPPVVTVEVWDVSVAVELPQPVRTSAATSTHVVPSRVSCDTWGRVSMKASVQGRLCFSVPYEWPIGKSQWMSARWTLVPLAIGCPRP